MTRPTLRRAMSTVLAERFRAPVDGLTGPRIEDMPDVCVSATIDAPDPIKHPPRASFHRLTQGGSQIQAARLHVLLEFGTPSSEEELDDDDDRRHCGEGPTPGPPGCAPASPPRRCALPQGTTTSSATTEAARYRSRRRATVSSASIRAAASRPFRSPWVLSPRRSLVPQRRSARG
jgi:hypothetical protein